jgi:MgtC family
MAIITLQQTATNLGVAVALGAAIGFERQWRQRLAGLRTNTLVALGAATFVVFESLFPNDGSPTRVAAQVVSGIGFLGAGIIFREGLNVRGLNTAATLWCSAAIGVLAGAGWGAGADCGAPEPGARGHRCALAGRASRGVARETGAAFSALKFRRTTTNRSAVSRFCRDRRIRP